ncbi:M48 family metallopeptidase [Egicoccus sp. AB-alg2]|uniref:M48 metallopeptidase family protein n=1 Tax=Egicoccus sp. AB-alg2 TaxID=3242693 RepID=UPI00359E4211
MSVEHRPAAAGRPELRIHRSPRRRRSASAAPEGAGIVIRLPAGLERVEEERLIDDLVAKVTRRRSRERNGGDAALEARARLLADRYLDGVRFTSVRWSPRMARRHGSCTPATGEIRISDRLASAPAWVLDAVLVHELAHLLERDHGPAFHALVARYPQAERARGWLEGFSAGQLAAGTPPDQVPAAPLPSPPSSSPSASSPSAPAPSAPSASPADC